MPQLRICAQGSSPQSQANKRGHLFEKLIAEVLRQYEYTISTRPSVNYAGMEIDIEGHETLTRIPLYAECKCYDTEVDAPKLQAFMGKYSARWLRDRRCRGLFIAIPGLNAHARGFYKENFEQSKEFSVSLLEQDGVMDSAIRAQVTVHGDVIRSAVPFGSTPGDQVFLYTDNGPIWVQYLVRDGSAIADAYALLTKEGRFITDRATADYVLDVCPDLKGFEHFVPVSPVSTVVGKELPLVAGSETDQIVEVRGSSTWFEYQFPASPEYFVGRTDLLRDVAQLADSVLKRETSVRGILFTGNSGWGKSSAVLSAAEVLRKLGHFAVVIDCRSVSAARSVLRAVDFALQKLTAEAGELFMGAATAITGFDGAVDALLTASLGLNSGQRLAFIFLDQFENLFFLPEALKRIRDLLLKMCDAQANIVFGFAWKTDLIGGTDDFPYRVRDSIAECSRRIPLDKFSNVETNALLDKLRSELRTDLRKDLRFFLSEFSQGFPWLLKKLCAHVKTQRENGVPQLEIANRLLNVEELFKEDLRGLTPDQEDALRRIAKSAPVTISELSEHFRPELVQSLVDARLVVRIGGKYDIYWDIFRDYLNEGLVPAQENYLPRALVSAVLRAMVVLIRAGSPLDLHDFQHKAGLSEHSAMNVIKDLRLLGLINAESGNFEAAIGLRKTASEAEIVGTIRTHLQDRLCKNRLVSLLIAELKSHGPLELSTITQRLSLWCPYVTAAPSTWRTYARLLMTWMDFADLATHKAGILSYYEPGTELRQRDLQFKRVRRKETLIPQIQFSPVENVALEICALLENKPPNWELFSKSTRLKSFATLEDLGFISRTPEGYRVIQDFHSRLSSSTEARRAEFAKAVLRLPAFSRFLSLLAEYSTTGCSHLELGRKLRNLLSVGWKDGTGKTNVKIMLDWARHLDIAHGVFSKNPRQRKVSGLTSPTAPAS